MRVPEINVFGTPTSCSAPNNLWGLLGIESRWGCILIHEFSPSGNLGAVLECNSAACRLFGVSEEELRRRPLMSFVTPADRHKITEKASRLLAEGSASLEIGIVRDTGDLRIVEVRSGSAQIGESFVGISVLRDETEARAADDALRRSHRELRALAARLSSNSEHERQLIAAELHDGVTQALAGLRFSLASLTGTMPKSIDSPIRGCLLDASDCLGDVLSQIRHLIHGLRPPMLEHFGLVAALRHHSEIFTKQTGITVVVEGEQTVTGVSCDTDLVLFRVAQEALINVAKHAEAQHVAVTIKSRADSVILHVSDDGCGFEPDRVMDTTSGERLGLTTMHERARSVGGYLKVESEPNKGSQVTLTVPVMRTVD